MAHQASGPAGAVSVGAVVARALRHRDTVLAASGFVATVLTDFFGLQFAAKWRVRRIPVVAVDHPLDAEIPFVPQRIDAYADFIAFWIRPLGALGARLGRRAQRRATVEFLGLLRRCYREAARVYRVRMSTTDRPRHRRGRFLAIHLFDPHLMCVPSLHVMVVVATWTAFRRMVGPHQPGDAWAASLEAELFAGAVTITESVLLVKQHSVNCVPAALYALARLTPADLTDADAHAFIDRLFRAEPEVAAPAASRIRAHIAATYAELAESPDADWTGPVLRMLSGFPVVR